jgi:hypothetical protein
MHSYLLDGERLSDIGSYLDKNMMFANEFGSAIPKKRSRWLEKRK